MKIQRRLDYKPSPFAIDKIELEIILDSTRAKIQSRLHVKRISKQDEPLFLHGEGLELQSVCIDDKDVTDETECQETGIVLTSVPDECVISVVNFINPAENKALEGLYMAGDAYCTQCEAEGFRRITYYLDRPDNLAVFTVTLHASAEKYPYLLANGNKVSETIEDGIRTTVWHDPYPKPSYLFAVVAGNFDVLTDTFMTGSGREVALEIYVDKGFSQRAEFALEALKRSMRWDEENYGREYDLDVYMIVAVDFFNMGAMENKGLNVFNSKYVLADSATATDTDFFNVESVIAHEYFHNWTGNRVTCRDWFQLSLKEGLTVFRDQQFSADMSSPLSTRISQVKVITEHQFAEDASAMSHPIRPDEVIEMNNFYTVTVYDKGAEVIRMLHSILGKSAYRQGMDTYFERHDGKAVTCDDFVDAMQSASLHDLSLFRRWYSQSGTPVVSISISVPDDKKTINVTISQTTPATADQSTKDVLAIPLRFSCYSTSGEQIPLQKLDSGLIEIQDNLVLLQSESAQMTFSNPGLNADEVIFTPLANFSAPVKIEQARVVSMLRNVAKYDPDPFNRWDAMQALYAEGINRLVASDVADMSDIISVLEELLANYQDQPQLLAELLTIPSTESLIQVRTQSDPVALNAARNLFCNKVAVSLQTPLTALYVPPNGVNYAYEQEQIDNRRLNHAVIMLLAQLESSTTFIEQLFDNSDNMTDTLTALKAAQICSAVLFDRIMTKFEAQWHDDSLVLDKWFSLHAVTEKEDILSSITLLQQHPRFSDDNPNRVRSLIGSFAFYNTNGFHAKDGSGYRFVTDYLLKLDKVNPQVASRIVTPLTQWQKLTTEHQTMMKAQLGRLVNTSGISKDLFEKVSKSLAYDKGQ